MDLRKSFSIAVLAFGTLSTAVMAEDALVKQMDLSSLKAKCSELASNQQLKPFKAVVTCREVSTIWRETTPESLQIQNAREVGASFRMKGFEVPFASEKIDVEPSLAACTVMEEYQVTVPAVDLELDCDGLLDVERLAELCTPQIEQRVKDDPSIMVEQKTGRTYNTCVGLSESGAGGGASGISSKKPSM